MTEEKKAELLQNGAELSEESLEKAAGGWSKSIESRYCKACKCTCDHLHEINITNSGGYERVQCLRCGLVTYLQGPV